jgi:hypothetical protein
MRDPDLVLAQTMSAPPALDDARNSLDYWQRRRKALPVYRLSARREAREMAQRWEERVLAAKQARFEASPFGRFMSGLGFTNVWPHWVRLRRKGLLAVAWMVVPPKLKLVAGAILATWLLVSISAVAVIAFVLAQLT